MPEKNRFHHFVYMLQEGVKLVDRSGSDSSDFNDLLHMTRDGAAFAETQALLSECLLWRYGGLILNVPAPKLGGRSFAPAPPLGADDVLVPTIRLPLGDDVGYDKRVIYRSGSPVETTTFDRLSQIFKVSSPGAMVLDPTIAPQNPWRAVAFRVTKRGSGRGRSRPARKGTIYRMGAVEDVIALERCKGEVRDDTLGYLAWVPADREAGIPAVLNVFGIGGTETMLWAAYLRRRAEGLIRELVEGDAPRVLVARFERPVLDTIPLDLSMVDGWGEIDWVLDSKYEPVEYAA